MNDSERRPLVPFSEVAAAEQRAVAKKRAANMHASQKRPTSVSASKARAARRRAARADEQAVAVWLRELGKERGSAAVPAEEPSAFTVSKQALRDTLAHPSAGEPARSLLRQIDSQLGDSDELLIAAMPSIEHERERMEQLVGLLMPDSIPQPIELLQARRSAAMRRDMLAGFGYFSAEELADLHGSQAKNRYALAARWTREGRVFGVPLGARTVYPAFQFDPDGRPYPIVAKVLAALPREDMSPWGVGLWWSANNAWLPAKARPAELIGGPEQGMIVEAAQRLAEPEPL